MLCRLVGLLSPFSNCSRRLPSKWSDWLESPGSSSLLFIFLELLFIIRRDFMLLVGLDTFLRFAEDFIVFFLSSCGASVSSSNISLPLSR